jgi:hypothetical protein
MFMMRALKTPWQAPITKERSSSSASASSLGMIGIGHDEDWS